ncbi:MAG: CHASE2 domain-containing protein [Thermosynechococcaceae cyanobacterium]
MQTITLDLGNGDLPSGCTTVTVKLHNAQGVSEMQCTGSLPPAPALAVAYAQWKGQYQARHQNQLMRIWVDPQPGVRYSEADLKAACQNLKIQLNAWLAADAFRPLEQALRRALSPHDQVQFVLSANQRELRSQPWHLWNFFADYPNIELALGVSNWQRLSKVPQTRSQVRILAILGDRQGLNTTIDSEALATLPNTELVVLEEPQRHQLNECLWDEQGWDILFFAGHSQTQDQVGYLRVSADLSLSLTELKHGLGKAIANGLQIAIFNSCDGLDLAHQLAELSMPYTIVMREAVADRVAHTFVQYFLQAFAQNKPCHLAVRVARERLEGLETDFPCASWMPVIWQNPTVRPLRWSDLQPQNNSLSKAAQALSWTKLLTVSLCITAAIIVGRGVGLFESLELNAYDTLLRQRTAEPPDARILVVEIGQDETNTHGYPLPDRVLTDLLDKLLPLKPNAIGLDLHRAKGAADSGLMKHFSQAENLFLVCSYSSGDQHHAQPANISGDKQINQMGFSDLLVDGSRPANGLRGDFASSTVPVGSQLMVRRQLLSYEPSLSSTPSSCQTPYSLSFQTAYQFLDHAGIKPLEVTEQQQWQFGPVELSELPSRFGGYQHLDGQSSQLMIHYRSQQPGQKVSLQQVLDGQIDPKLIRDRIILIGYSAPIARDYFETPYGPMAGVWIHAHMTSQLISAVLDQRPLVWTLPQWKSWQWGDWLWIGLWSGMGSLMTWPLARTSQLSVRPLLWIALSAGLASSGLYLICFVGITQGGWLPLVPALLALWASAGAMTLLFSYRMLYQYQRAATSLPSSVN